MNSAQPLPALLSMNSVDHIRERFETLKKNDAQFRDTLPLASVAEAKCRPELGLAEVVATCLEAYSARPALAERATRFVTDPATGRTRCEQLKSYESVSYAELWERARALAALWYQRGAQGLRANDFLCIIAFAGIDFATVDLAAVHNGAVIVPLQTNAPTAQLIDIVKEVEPRWLATSLECLHTSVDLVLKGHAPAGLLLFNYHPQVDEERESFEIARARLKAAGLGQLLVTLDEACALGRALPAAPLYAEPGIDQRLCTIYYTSGSMGLPKGAMYPEPMVKPTLRTVTAIPLLLHALHADEPLVWAQRRISARWDAGGTVYFTAKSDLSALFEDIKLVRPTFMGIVPRHLRDDLSALPGRGRTARAGHERSRGAETAKFCSNSATQVLGGRLLNWYFRLRSARTGAAGVHRSLLGLSAQRQLWHHRDLGRRSQHPRLEAPGDRLQARRCARTRLLQNRQAASARRTSDQDTKHHAGLLQAARSRPPRPRCRRLLQDRRHHGRGRARITWCTSTGATTF